MYTYHIGQRGDAMQYHLNGFRPGDPEVLPSDRPAQGPLPGEIDVLIVGCGPAGLTLAAQLARFPGIVTRIVERKPGPMEKGQADGISCRSMEMFNAFGFAATILKQGYWVNETTFWKPDPDTPGHITRTGRVQDVEDGLSEMPHIILNQARVHDLYLDTMRKAPARLAPDYGCEFVTLELDPAGGSHPVRVTLAEVATGRQLSLRARYVVGCDGARSGVRRAIGAELAGESANHAWGVMDVLAVTDFPDIRCKTLIQPSGGGNIIIIPREGGYLLRFYVELGDLEPGRRFDRSEITVDRLIEAVQRTFRPYQFHVKEVAWWSVYEIGQRLTDRFDDSEAGDGRDPRIFIAGDACHTHSPKAGQGMNVSMGDAFNLGWKLVSVLTGRSSPDLLATYSDERQAVAKDLIDFDREWSQIIGQRATATGAEAQETPKFQRYFVEHGRYTAGMSVTYKPSVLTGSGKWQALAPGFPLGERLHSAPVVRLADAKPMELADTISADARWRLYVFAPEEKTTGATSAMRALCDFLASDPLSPILHHTPANRDIDAIIDVRAVFQQATQELALETMPALLLPPKGRLGLIDYEKMFCADRTSGHDIFDLRRIDRQKGCLLVVRPDQYVADLLPLHAHEELSRFFAGVFLPANVQSPIAADHITTAG